MDKYFFRLGQEDSKSTRAKATDYVSIHGTVLAAQLNDTCYTVF
jgi:hypothetical protein